MTRSCTCLLLVVAFSCLLHLYVCQQTYFVQWRPESLSLLNNVLNVHLQDIVILGCNIELVSNYFLSTSQAAFTNCDLSQFTMEGAHCQQFNVNLTIQLNPDIPGTVQYQEGSTYYYVSTHNNECVNGIKLALNVVARTSSLSASSTVAATHTTTATSQSTGTTITTNTGTYTAAYSTVTTGTTITTNTGTYTAAYSTVMSSSVATTVTPTVGGVNDETGSILGKLPFNGAVVLPLAAVIFFSVTVIIILLCVLVCCKYKKRHSDQKDLVKSCDDSKESFLNKGGEAKEMQFLETVDSGRENGKGQTQSWSIAKRSPPIPPSNGATSTSNGSSSSGSKRKAPRPPAAKISVPKSLPSTSGPPAAKSSRPLAAKSSGPKSLPSTSGPPAAKSSGPQSLPSGPLAAKSSGPKSSGPSSHKAPPTKSISLRQDGLPSQVVSPRRQAPVPPSQIPPLKSI